MNTQSDVKLSERGKAFLGEHRDQLYTLLIIVLVAFLAFGLGRLSVYYGEKGELKVEYPKPVNP